MKVFSTLEDLERILEMRGGAKTIDNLLMGRYRAAGLEQLKLNALLSVHPNLSDRILLRIVAINGERCFQVVAIALNHDYDKAIRSVEKNSPDSPKNGLKLITPEDLQHQCRLQDAKEGASSSDTLAGQQRAEIHHAIFWQNQVLELNASQSEVLGCSLPLLVGGGPGSGKSCLARQLVEQLSAGLEDARVRIVYLTSSDRLARKMEAEWVIQGGMDSPHCHQVLFMTQEELLEEELWPAEHDDRKKERVGKAQFTSWWRERCKQKLFKRWKNESADRVYQELRLLSGYTKQQYLDLGKKRSIYTEQTDREELYQAYEAYLAELNRLNQLNLDFYRFSGEKKYHFVIDEAMDFSNGALRALTRLSKNAQIACFVDSNQSLEDEHSNRAFLLQMFAEESGQKRVSHVELPGSYRCPAAVLRVAKALLAIKHTVTGGLADKYEACDLMMPGSAVPLQEGSVTYVSPTADLRVYIEKANSPTVVVITEEALLEEAKQLFKTPLVLTPGESKGLEYLTVIAYKPFEHPVYEEINKKVPDAALTVKTHRAKAEDRAPEYGPPMNHIFTAVTRTQEELVVCQDFTRELAKIELALKAHASQSTPSPREKVAAASGGAPEVSQSTNLAAWQAEMLRQLAVGNRHTAVDIFVTKLQGLAADFDGFISELQAVKTASRTDSQTQQKETPTHNARTTSAATPQPQRKPKKISKATPKVAHSDQVPSKFRAYGEKLLLQENFTRENISSLLIHAKLLEILDTVLGDGTTIYQHIVSSPEKMAVFLAVLDSDLRYIDTLSAYVVSKKILATDIIHNTKTHTIDWQDAETPIICRVLENNITFNQFFQTRELEKLLTRIQGIESLPLVTLIIQKKLTEQMIEKAIRGLNQKNLIQALAKICTYDHARDHQMPLIYFLCTKPDSPWMVPLVINLLTENIPDAEESQLANLCAALSMSAPCCESTLFVLCETHPEHVLSLLSGRLSHYLDWKTLFHTRSRHSNRTLLHVLSSQHNQICAILESLLTKIGGDIYPHITHDALRITYEIAAPPDKKSQISFLYNLSSRVPGINVLNEIFKNNPDLYTRMNADDLSCTLKAPNGSFSVLYNLANYEPGQYFLHRLCQKNPDAYAGITYEILCNRAASNSPSSSLFYQLSQSSRTKILQTIFNKNRALYQEIQTSDLCVEANSQDDDSVCTPLWNLSAFRLPPLTFLKKLLRENPQIFTQISSAELCHPASKRKCSVLYNLASYQIGRQFLSKLIDCSPDFAVKITLQSLLARTTPLPETQERPLSVLCQLACDPVLLKKIFDHNPKLYESVDYLTLFDEMCDVHVPSTMLSSPATADFLQELVKRRPQFRDIITALEKDVPFTEKQSTKIISGLVEKKKSVANHIILITIIKSILKKKQKQRQNPLMINQLCRQKTPSICFAMTGFTRKQLSTAKRHVQEKVPTKAKESTQPSRRLNKHR